MSHSITILIEEDFTHKLDRSEVEHIASIVHGAAVEVAVASGGTNAVHSTICGGYRRGKQQSGDVDIVLTHESCHGFTDMMKPLIRRLEIIGLLDQEIIASSQYL